MTNDSRSGSSFVIRHSYYLSQEQADVPTGNSWLSPQESARAAQFRFPKRRSDWLLGRWTAKIAVRRYLSGTGVSVELAAIEIRSAPDGAPDPYVANSPAPLSLSLSHSSGTSFVAITEAGTPVGCDIERIEPHSPEFLLDYFTDEEREFAETGAPAQRPLRCTLIWSAKESALKWLRQGLRLDTRAVRVSVGDPQPGWSPLTVSCPQQLAGWWRQDLELVETVVGERIAAPLPL